MSQPTFSFPTARSGLGFLQRGVTSSRTGRWGEQTMALRTGLGLTLTVQTRGWIFSRQEVERRAGALTNGQFAAVMRRYGELRAQELQAAVGRALEEGRVPSRRGMSTGRLEWVLLHPSNRVVRPFAFGVGVPSWLNRSRAKYWRQIDQGFVGHVGRELIGTWGEGPMRPSAGRLYPGEPYTRPGVNRSGSFVPYSVLARSRTRVGRSVVGRPLSEVAGRGVIRRPIEPQRYFIRAWRASNMRAKAIADLRQAIAEVLGIPTGAVR